MKISNFTSNSGNLVPNQFYVEDAILTIEGQEMRGELFQSYDSLIAFKDYLTGEIYLDSKYWNYSRTTGKYRNQFLGENTQETRKNIKCGIYKLVDLNANSL